MYRTVASALGAWSAAAVAALGLMACSPKEDAPARAGQTAPAGQAAKPPRRAEDDARARLNLYVKCYNKADRIFHQALDSYASSVNRDSGPTGRERRISIREVSGTQNCRKAVDQAKGMSSAMPALDQAAEAYAASLTPLEATINEASLYYDRQKYQDDNHARGKALHPLLIEQGDAFAAASQRFSDALDEAEGVQQQADLQREEKENGRSQAYYRLATQMQAKQLMRLLTQDSVDLGQADAMLTAFGKTIGELKDEKEERGDRRSHLWNLYVEEAYHFRKAATERVKRLRDKEPYSQHDKLELASRTAWSVKGSPDAVLHAYNELIGASNRL
jgi:hypothetical protein